MRSVRFALLVLTLCFSSSGGADLLSEGPFAGIDLSKLPEKHAKVIRKASEDFELVKRGKKPRHAVFDTNAPLPTDGGTTFYLGNRYKLSIVQSLSDFGGLFGYLYGPFLTFDPEFAEGNNDAVIAIRFYTPEQLAALKSESAK